MGLEAVMAYVYAVPFVIVASVNVIALPGSVVYAKPFLVTVTDEIGFGVVGAVVKLTVIEPPPTAAVADVITGAAGTPNGLMVAEAVE